MPFGLGQPTVPAIVSYLETNRGELHTLDVSKNASVRMRPTESILALAKVLAQDSHIRVLILKECELDDSAGEVLSDLLTRNHTIEELDLQSNQLTSAGAVSLARGLERNRGLRVLNLLGQTKAFGEECADQFKRMFESNLHLTKLMWNLKSGQSWALSQLITRNNEVWRRVAAGRDYLALLPDAYQEAPPQLSSAPNDSRSRPSDGAREEKRTLARQARSEQKIGNLNFRALRDRFEERSTGVVPDMASDGQQEDLTKTASARRVEEREERLAVVSLVSAMSCLFQTLLLGCEERQR